MPAGSTLRRGDDLARPAVARPNEDAPGAGREAGLHVGPFVADRERARQIEVEILCRGAQHTGAGLAAVAVLPVALDLRGGMVRTVVEAVDAAAARVHPFVDDLVRAVNELLLIHAAADARLVGDDDDGEAGAVQQADGVDGEGEEDEPLEPIEVSRLFEHRAIAIEEDGPLRSSTPIVIARPPDSGGA